MRILFPEVVDQRRFDDFVGAPLALLLVKRHVRLGDRELRLLRAVGDYLEAQHPEMRVGHFSAASVPTPAWLLRKVRRGRVAKEWPEDADEDQAPNGFYLFRDGEPLSFHPGNPNYKKDLTQLTPAQTLSALVSSVNEKVAVQSLCDYFDAALAPQPKIFRRRERVVAAASSPPPPTTLTLAEHYAVLEISPSASDAEVKAARTRRLAQCHTDKLDHASNAIKEFAKRESQKILDAYEAIMRSRGKWTKTNAR